ncbi:MAG: T9SS type A sorting domain-containing protein, partial [Flavobacteriales bacterium]|nr:T9SS type A sorting domain-containing protein [Flavobacteriales bacterium]
VQLIAVNGDCSVGIDVEAQADLHVVPNPTSGVFRLVGVPTPARYVLLDVQGKVLRSGSLNGADPVVDLEGAAVSGTYTLRITTPDQVSNHRVVVEPMR